MLGDRWYPIKAHPVREAFYRSTARFQVGCAGRRSGKTEVAKRKLIRAACAYHSHPDGRFLFAAPTNDQARKIYWRDAKLLTPEKLVKSVSESRLEITLITGTIIGVVGMDKPARVEGPPLDGIVLDEYADMKPEVWGHHVRPALDAHGRSGWGIFIGKPKLGARHYRDLFNRALRDDEEEWDAFHWTSEEILSEAQISAARADMDPLSYEYEYLASWAAAEGRVYYPFDRSTHCAALEYDPYLPLVFCFDFNVEPGVAVVAQEQFDERGDSDVPGDERVTAIVGEVHIPKNSNTPAVCRRLIEDWGHHKGEIYGYGDATGGARGTAQVDGSDWELIDQAMSAHFKKRWNNYVQRSNPPERARVNAVNARLLAMDGKKRMLIHEDCEHLIEDFESVQVLKGSAGEIDKKSDKTITHMTDALGYYVDQEFPMGEHELDRQTVI